MSESGSTSPCRTCGYDLSGNALGVCPECGEAAFVPVPRNTDAVRAAAASRGLSCRHCRRPLSEMVDGACACGATYQLSSPSVARRPSQRPSFIDAMVVLAAIVGAGVALVGTILAGLGDAKMPESGPLLLACVPVGVLLLVVIARPVLRKLPAELYSLTTAFLLVVGGVCLFAAAARLW